ncbi:MAG: hypothetical protein Q8N03_03015 [Ignavibacteria bacterium]|nr:hypothetical protein [Ignavibacteria bacterium]
MRFGKNSNTEQEMLKRVQHDSDLGFGKNNDAAQMMLKRFASGEQHDSFS